jgi:hypothetical protein
MKTNFMEVMCSDVVGLAKKNRQDTDLCVFLCTRWFKYDRDYLCVNKKQFVPGIFEPPRNYVGR